MVDIFIRANESCRAPGAPLLWDTVWEEASFSGTWALAGQQPGNAGGLLATEVLETAVIMCLFTDARCPPDHPLARYADPNDLRGWWGDGADVDAAAGEGPLGSLLWLLERSVATPAMAQWAQSLAAAALQPLIGQMAVARIDTSAGVLPLPAEGLWLDVAAYAQDGTKIYARRFQAIWKQVLPQTN